MYTLIIHTKHITIFHRWTHLYPLHKWKLNIGYLSLPLPSRLIIVLNGVPLIGLGIFEAYIPLPGWHVLFKCIVATTWLRYLNQYTHPGANTVLPKQSNRWNITRGVSQCDLAIYIKKYLKAKEELWKLKYFTMQKYNLQKKILSKKPKSFKVS
jgi:hypothetical protein